MTSLSIGLCLSLLAVGAPLALQDTEASESEAPHPAKQLVQMHRDKLRHEDAKVRHEWMKKFVKMSEHTFRQHPKEVVQELRRACEDSDLAIRLTAIMALRKAEVPGQAATAFVHALKELRSTFANSQHALRYGVLDKRTLRTIHALSETQDVPTDLERQEYVHSMFNLVSGELFKGMAPLRDDRVVDALVQECGAKPLMGPPARLVQATLHQASQRGVDAVIELLVYYEKAESQERSARLWKDSVRRELERALLEFDPPDMKEADTWRVWWSLERDRAVDRLGTLDDGD